MGSIIKGILRISTHPTGKTPHTQERDGSEDYRRDQRKSSIRSIDGEDDEGNGVGYQLGCGGEGNESYVHQNHKADGHNPRHDADLLQFCFTHLIDLVDESQRE